MEPWALALLMKPVGVLLCFVLIVVIPAGLVYLLRPLFPEGRVKDFLFRERGRQRAQGSAGTGDGGFDDAPIRSGDASEDRPRLIGVRQNLD